MATHHSVDPSHAAQALRTLDGDRTRLAVAARPPAALMVALGALAAWWVGAAAGTSPGAGYTPPTSSWLAVAAAVGVAYAVRTRTGVRFRRAGARATITAAALVAVCLVLYSVSLALVSAGATWAVALTSLAAFAAVTWLSTVAYRAAADHVARA
ncbi:hypothetical protein [Actinotalea sp. K2]|uniref:hypothetical protein n=1 Tax=Actinotalea sp. K2 TaxID=2939438 RepID=UPI0020180A6E|nr:hypothetical protein [Actinotalea sp. K2]MCL3863107.1 hypothetical protein [Actinotalea sp. K2]